MDLNKKLHSLRVLVIDNEPGILELVKNMLNEMGITHVYQACDGQEALTVLKLQSEKAELIICDWNMPGMTGIELLKSIRGDYPDLPFLMITSRNDQTSIIDAMQQGVNAYVLKPFTPEKLESTISFLVSKNIP